MARTHAQGLPKHKYEVTLPDGTKHTTTTTRRYTHAVAIQHSDRSSHGGPAHPNSLERTPPGSWGVWQMSGDHKAASREATRINTYRHQPTPGRRIKYGGGKIAGQKQYGFTSDAKVIPVDNPRPEDAGRQHHFDQGAKT